MNNMSDKKPKKYKKKQFKSSCLFLKHFKYLGYFLP